MAIEGNSTPPTVTPLSVNPGRPSVPPATIPAVAPSATALPTVPELNVSSGTMSASDVVAQAQAVRLAAATQSPAGTVPTLVDRAVVGDVQTVDVGSDAR